MSGDDAFEGGGGRRFDPREFMRLVVRFGWIALVLAVTEARRAVRRRCSGVSRLVRAM